MAMDLLNHDEGWVIKTDEEAQWALHKIADANAENEAWKKHYKQALQKIVDNNNRTVEIMTEKLKVYFENCPHRTTRAGWLVYDLPNGAQMIQKPSGVDYDHDDDLICGWAIENKPELIKVQTSLDWSKMKSTLTIIGGEIYDKETGEKVDIDGLKLKEVEQKFTLKMED